MPPKNFRQLELESWQASPEYVTMERMRQIVGNDKRLATRFEEATKQLYAEYQKRQLAAIIKFFIKQVQEQEDVYETLGTMLAAGELCALKNERTARLSELEDYLINETSRVIEGYLKLNDFASLVKQRVMDIEKELTLKVIEKCNKFWLEQYHIQLAAPQTIFAELQENQVAMTAVYQQSIGLMPLLWLYYARAGVQAEQQRQAHPGLRVFNARAEGGFGYSYASLQKTKNFTIYELQTDREILDGVASWWGMTVKRELVAQTLAVQKLQMSNLVTALYFKREAPYYGDSTGAGSGSDQKLYPASILDDPEQLKKFESFRLINYQNHLAVYADRKLPDLLRFARDAGKNFDVEIRSEEHDLNLANMIRALGVLRGLHDSNKIFVNSEKRGWNDGYYGRRTKKIADICFTIIYRALDDF